MIIWSAHRTNQRELHDVVTCGREAINCGEAPPLGSEGRSRQEELVDTKLSYSRQKQPGTSLKLPLEVGLQLMASRPPACDHIVELLDWFDEPDQIIIIMEHPAPCMDLIDLMYTTTQGALCEDFVRRIWKQAVLACRHCRDRGVLHRDIKAQNLLLQLDTFTVKLVDFGCGDLLQEELYSEYCGTLRYCPPEMLINGTYNGDEATVWSLGILLYLLANGRSPFQNKEQICGGHNLPFIKALSDARMVSRSTTIRKLKDGEEEPLISDLDLDNNRTHETPPLKHNTHMYDGP
ncbi:hypothetical protein DPEC_G00171230 [Dallia pectoralis]|uniref:Uncharacterized protein n=1 Tax=Dallia pectoralis TaxID=75939 RepID=A0ACC2GD60_DALPE|nr:hypothetical protein DPEC_G00171230 [Dallia pectoralis]